MARTARDVGWLDWSVTASLWLVLAFVAFGDLQPPGGVWGLTAWLVLPAFWRIVAAAVLAVAIAPPVRRRLLGQLKRLDSLTQAARGVPPWAWICLIVAVCWLLRSNRFYGDAPAIAEAIQNGQWINHKEPLDRLVSSAIYRVGHELIRWDVVTALALVNTLVGCVFWAGLGRFARLARVQGPGRVSAVVIVASTGVVQFFCGYVESYSFLAAGTIWTLVLCVEAAEDQHKRLWPAAAAYGVTFASHLAAAWLAGAPLATWAVRAVRRYRTDGRPRRVAGATVREAVVGAGMASLPLLLLGSVMVAGGIGLGGFSTTNFGGGDGVMFVPLLSARAAMERFTMFSSEHLAAFTNELLLVVPVGLVLAVACGLRLRSVDGAGDAAAPVLLAASAGTVAYAFVFNPDLMVFYPELGPLVEWDLFAFLAIPIAMLGASWFRRAVDEGVMDPATGFAAAIVALAHTAVWIVFNAVP